MIAAKAKRYTRAFSSIVINSSKNLFSNPAVILLYHRIANLEADPQLLAVSPDNFDRQVRHLLNNYNVCSLSDLVRSVKSNGIPHKSVVITFDDGYKDNYCNALPILQKYNIPASFFIATASIGNNSGFWWDKIEMILSEDMPPALEMQIRGVRHNYRMDSDRSRTDSYIRLHKLLMTLSSEDRNAVMKEIESKSSDKLNFKANHSALSREEILLMASNNLVEIGAHTHTHPQLSALTAEEQFYEIKTGKEILENLINRNVALFSYPFGARRDYSDDTIKICQGLNFEASCANFPDQIRASSDLFQLPRFLVRNWPIETFRKHLVFFFYR